MLVVSVVVVDNLSQDARWLWSHCPLFPSFPFMIVVLSQPPTILDILISWLLLHGVFRIILSGYLIKVY